MGLEDTVVAGRYRLLAQAGQGAMGVVWRAQDERLSRLVALKQIIHELDTPQTTRSRRAADAVREARLTARVKHPHAVTVYDVIEDAGSVYLVLEYLPSRSLTDLLLDRGRPLPAAEVAEFGRQVASALTVAHAEGVLHRDITPNNVLITQDGTAMITDFGIAHAVGDGTMTGGGLVAGTPAYLAPEVADGGDCTFASDVYSLGATLYTALEGAPPSGIGDNPIVLLKRIARGDITAPAQAGPLTDVILGLLRHDPAERPSMADAEAMLAAPARASNASGVRDRTPRLGRRLTVTVAAGVVAAACLTGVVLSRPQEEVAAPVPVPTPVPTPSGITVERTVAVTTTAVAAERTGRVRGTAPPPAADRPGCSADFSIASSWPDGAQASVTVRNDRGSRIAAWTVTWTQPAGVTVRDLWNGTLTQTGQTLTVTNAAWNGVIEPGGSTTFGLNLISPTGKPGIPSLRCSS